MTDKLNIPTLRQRIDQIDDTILDLLKERLDCAKTIGQLKTETNRAKWDPQRELEIYDRLRKNNNDIFPYKALRSIFHEIITTCRLSQRKAIVASPSEMKYTLFSSIPCTRKHTSTHVFFTTRSDIASTFR